MYFTSICIGKRTYILAHCQYEMPATLIDLIGTPHAANIERLRIDDLHKMMREFHAVPDSNIYPINVYKHSKSKAILAEREDESIYRKSMFEEVFGIDPGLICEPVKTNR